MKKILEVWIFLILVVNVSAMTTNITVVSDDVYTGAILKLRSLENGELGNPYYPIFVGKNVGIIKFEVETGLSEVNLSLRFIDNGEVCLNVEKGPFAINGSEIVVDLREIVNTSVVEENDENVSKEVSGDNISKIDGENVTLVSKDNLVGYASQNHNVMPTNIYALVVVCILFTGGFLFFIIRSAYRSGAKRELRELGRMEVDKHLDELDEI